MGYFEQTARIIGSIDEYYDYNVSDDNAETLNSLAASVNAKVDKINGKGLSEADFTTAEKIKLAGIAAGAQVNHGEATASANGLMTAAMVTKLNGIAAGAQVNPGAATASANGLMSAADKSKLDGMAAFAGSWTQLYTWSGSQSAPLSFTLSRAAINNYKLITVEWYSENGVHTNSSTVTLPKGRVNWDSNFPVGNHGNGDRAGHVKITISGDTWTVSGNNHNGYNSISLTSIVIGGVN